MCIAIIVNYFLCFSDFLYDISHPDKEGFPQQDLSTDVDDMLDPNLKESFSPKQLAVERVIVKTFTTYRCDAVITDRLRSLFKSKLWRMRKQIQSLGGTGREYVLKKWQSTRWEIQLNENEIIPRTKGQKTHVVTTAASKCAVLQSKLKESEKKLQDTTNELEALEKSALRLSNAIRGQTSSKCKRKAWEDCTAQYKSQQRKKIKQDVQTALSFTETENFQPVKIEVINKHTIHVECSGSDCNIFDGSSDKSLVEKMLYVKDRYHISDVAYHELAQVNSDLPRKLTLSKASKQLNAKSNIQPTLGQTTGIKQSLEERLIIRLRHALKSDPSFALQSTIRVKITGDGTVVSRSLHLVVIAFSLFTDEENPRSLSGNHTIALLSTTEDYANMAEALEKVLEDIKMMKSITIDSVTFAVEFFLVADWKFLALVVGIESALARYSCIWCKCASEERHITSKWSMDDQQKGARTIAEMQELARSKKRGVEKYGCVRQPLFPTIQIDHVIPDVLHLFCEFAMS